MSGKIVNQVIKLSYLLLDVYITVLFVEILYIMNTKLPEVHGVTVQY